MGTWLVVAAAFLAGAYVKGTTAMGFPLIATPMVAMVVDIPTAYALLVVPNIVMDVLQLARGGVRLPLARRLWPLLVAVVPGVFLGTRILLAIPERAVFLALAATILAFLATHHLEIRIRVPKRAERPAGIVAGLLCGLLNGVTNVIGPLAAVYLLALDLQKREFVKAMAWILLTAKVSQLAAIFRWGVYTASLFTWSAVLTVAALGAFWVGLKTQDRVRQESFRRILNVLLFAMAVFFIYKGAM